MTTPDSTRTVIRRLFDAQRRAFIAEGPVSRPTRQARMQRVSRVGHAVSDRT